MHGTIIINLDDLDQLDALFEASAWCAKHPNADFMRVLEEFLGQCPQHIRARNREAQRDRDDEESGDYR